MEDIIFPLLAMVSFGISPLFYKTIMNRGIHPLKANWIRALMVLPLMLLFFIFSLDGIFNVGTHVLMILALIAFFGPVMGDSLYFFSLRYIDVSLTAPISSVYSLLIPLWMFIFFHSYTSMTIILGAFLIIAGIYLLQKRKMTLLQKRGVIYAFLSAIFYSFAILLMGLVMPIASAETITIYRIIFSIIFLTPVSLWNGDIPLDPRVWLILAVGGFFGIGVGIVFMLYGIQFSGVVITGVFSSASPLITSILGIIIYRESRGKRKIAGIALIGAGLIISSL
ncbi:MAG: DMT family transporter [Thermoplasmata archaeon]